MKTFGLILLLVISIVAAAIFTQRAPEPPIPASLPMYIVGRKVDHWYRKGAEWVAVDAEGSPIEIR